MSDRPDYVFKFGEFSLDPARRLLVRTGQSIPLTPKAFDTLLVLVRENGKVVKKDDLLREVWPDTFVEESTLAQNIFTLRRALGKQGDANQFIQTVPRQGYRFAAEVQTLTGDPPGLIHEKNTQTRIASEEIKSNGHQESDSRTVVDLQTTQGLGSQVSPPVLVSRSRLMTPTRVVAAMVLVACLIAAWIVIRTRVLPASPEAKTTMRIRRLTTIGHVVRATTSDDNAYVAYVIEEGGQQSLWLQQLSATVNVQIIAPRPVVYRGISFARDRSSIYFVEYDPPDPVSKLFQVPLLGGTPRMVTSDIDTSISFSPDGKHLCFFRDDVRLKTTTLITVAIDGSDERRLVSHPGKFFGDGPAWSPDGKTIAYPLFPDGDPNRYQAASLTALRVSDGTEQTVTARRWEAIGSLSWFGNDSLVIVAFDETTDGLSSQLWQVSVGDGNAKRVTNDLNFYSGLGLSAAANALVTIQSDRISDLWVADVSDPGSATEISSGQGDKSGEILGIEWASNNRIVFGSSGGGNADIWSIDPDGRNRRQLTLDPRQDLRPSVSAADHSIVFVSKRTGIPHLWKMDSEGRNLKQLTDGNTAEGFPSLSRDGKWLTYISVNREESTLWKLSLETAERQQLTQTFSWMPSVSPDGKSIACFYDDRSGLPTRIAIIPAAGGTPTQLLDLPPSTFMKAGFRWSPDGKSLTYVRNNHNVSNIVSQPLNGSAPKQLTHFKSAQIFRFAWAPDGKRVVLERGTNSRDVILIKDFAQPAA